MKHFILLGITLLLFASCNAPEESVKEPTKLTCENVRQPERVEMELLFMSCIDQVGQKSCPEGHYQCMSQVAEACNIAINNLMLRIQEKLRECGKLPPGQPV